MPTTPMLTSVRNQLVLALENINGSGNYWHTATIEEGVPDHEKINALNVGQAILFVLRSDIEYDERYVTPQRRRLRVLFTVRGYLQDANNRNAIEKLEQDIYRACLAKLDLTTGADMARFESAEISDDEFQTDDGMVAHSYVEVRLRADMSEQF